MKKGYPAEDTGKKTGLPLGGRGRAPDGEGLLALPLSHRQRAMRVVEIVLSSKASVRIPWPLALLPWQQPLAALPCEIAEIPGNSVVC